MMKVAPIAAVSILAVLRNIACKSFSPDDEKIDEAADSALQADQWKERTLMRA